VSKFQIFLVVAIVWCLGFGIFDFVVGYWPVGIFMLALSAWNTHLLVKSYNLN